MRAKDVSIWQIRDILDRAGEKRERKKMDRAGETRTWLEGEGLPFSEAKELIDTLREDQVLDEEGFFTLLSGRSEKNASYLFEQASRVREANFGNGIYLRGLIEVSSYCRNDCSYCGLRRSNQKAERYRLTEEEILKSADIGFDLGFRTFVLQGGEDLFYSDEDICRIVSRIRERHPEAAITLSIGERERESYQAYFDAGADRYLLRHESADADHYASLHADGRTLETRIRCLENLKEIGFQLGAGMMVGSPGQTLQHLVKDLLFLKAHSPQMIGIGPFIPHKDTPYRGEKAGSAELTLYLLGILRLMFPEGLIPATTALGTIDALGREKGVQAGANVIMPNLSPLSVRSKYLLYDGKICQGDEAAECIACMGRRMERIGCRIAEGRGDAPGWTRR